MRCDFSDIPSSLGEVVTVIKHAVASRTGVLFRGPPGIGATMLARRIPSILPRLSRSEAEDLAEIYLRCGLNHRILGDREHIEAKRLGVDLLDPYVREPPFRAPHHTISSAGLIETSLLASRLSRSPSEIALAKYGVLFLDELPEFQRNAIDALQAFLALADSRVMIVAAARKCACGMLGSTRPCCCSKEEGSRYDLRVRMFANMLRIPMTVDIPQTTLAELRSEERCQSSVEIRAELGITWWEVDDEGKAWTCQNIETDRGPQ